MKVTTGEKSREDSKKQDKMVMVMHVVTTEKCCLRIMSLQF